jgi:D-glycero-D-manno-heptose 1,7-bisphosphate phosphatase
MKAIFFDRDGTIIIDKHYMHKPEEIEYFNDTFTAIKTIQELGYEIFMVTNQSGVGRGYFKLEDAIAVNHQIQIDLSKNNLNKFKDIKICPQHPDEENNFRKPSPIMINELSKEYNIELSESYMIGDKLIDAQSGQNAGCAGILYKFKDEAPFKNYNTLTDFAQSLQ